MLQVQGGCLLLGLQGGSLLQHGIEIIVLVLVIVILSISKYQYSKFQISTVQRVRCINAKSNMIRQVKRGLYSKMERSVYSIQAVRMYYLRIKMISKA